ncbi:hypothetical protein BDK51DRAFT_28316 [Blyttiomyces helicus]|uniref:Uncharacterized protein n=1 Tax=Blyttiomyces helicus TaxID=388810 RepID=A0A4P9WMW8_9FUNG|nr:hypothetical protein BDK51DRAFT_28316 [Blyttiomyces helicus]|eukprot:RKO93842.1 hypothetical protein BDK51DRAFT_28316 [Blyttiomyces helicus]
MTIAELKVPNNVRTATFSLPGYVQNLSKLIIGFTQDREILVFLVWEMYEGKFKNSYLHAALGHQSWYAFNDNDNYANSCNYFVIYCEAVLLSEVAAYLKNNDQACLELLAEKRDIDRLTWMVLIDLVEM